MIWREAWKWARLVGGLALYALGAALLAAAVGAAGYGCLRGILWIIAQAQGN